MAITTVDFPLPLPATKQTSTSWLLQADGIEQKVTNLTKLYWQQEGYTKGDLLAYYYNVARWILPFLADRPLTLKRMPDGADGDFFYAKNAPDHVPDWMPRAPVVSDDSGKVISYLMAQDTASLIYVANLGCIEMHPWHSRRDALGYPDYAFFDLDPMEVGFDVVKQVALLFKVVLDQLGLTGYPRTSGATGLHIYVPIDRVHMYAEVRELITRLCRLVNRADPARTTMEWQISDRTGKVFLDAGMNTEGRNIASAYSLRPHRGATVSMPLRWEELEGSVEPGDFTIANVWGRLDEVGDAFTAVLAGGQTLWTAMESVGLDTTAERRGPSHSLGQVEGQTSGDMATPAEPAEPAEPAQPLRRSAPDPGPDGDVNAGTETRTNTTAHPDIDPDAGELDTYAAKRDFGRTAEPAGGPVTPTAGSRFVLQHHLATRLHHDLRLERGGTLRSWALPKGLPLVPSLPHLAMQTEDHPMEYLTFHGEIPAGEYGGGQMRIWDSGTYETLEWEDGKVTFRLAGHRHLGEWHLFRIGQGPKKRNEWMITRSARDLIELPPPPPQLAPCLATGGGKPFDDDDWRFEVKWDGVRAIATTRRPGAGTKDANDGSTTLFSRNGNDITAAYPELGHMWERVLAFNAVLDGEIVALGADGRPSFGLLQQRMHLRDASRVDRARRASPVSYMVFDVLAVDGEQLTAAPLDDRLAVLDELLIPDQRIVRSDSVVGKGTALFAAAQAQRLEGVMAKRRTSRYLPGRRTPDWVKIKVRRTAEVVAVGWVAATTGADDLGAMLMAAHDEDGRLVYLGRVGTGFDAAEQARLRDLLDSHGRDDPPLQDTERIDTASPHVHWCDPVVVLEVTFAELTSEGRLRAPSYHRTVEDADPAGARLADVTAA